MSRIETHRNVARLRLLDAGALVEAGKLESMLPKIASKTKNSGNAKEDDTVESAMEIDEEDESEDAYIKRVNKFVEHCLKKKRGQGSSRLTVEEEELKSAIGDFFKRLQAKKKCENCGAYSPTYRKDGFVKIFQQPLPKKLEAQNNARKFNISHRELLARAKRRKSGQMDEEQSSEDEPMSDVEDTNEKSGEDGPVSKQNIMTPMHVRSILRLMWQKESAAVQQLFGVNAKSKNPSYSGADMFFIDVVPVPPSRFRPASTLGDKVFENPQTEQLGAILTTCERLRDLEAGGNNKKETAEMTETDVAKPPSSLSNIVNSWMQLQSDVNSFLDSTKSGVPPKGGKQPSPGIRQALEKKEGLFRKHMMGKRVNYAARSVISPDPNIETSEIGVPPVFAIKLTYPEPVTHHNVKELRQAVINGPKVWPGATHVQHEDGELTALEHLSKESRIALANQLLTPQDFKSSALEPGAEAGAGTCVRVNKKVLRHLRDGDVVLMNRQPTLHKPSIMAHRVKVLPGEKTIRMHYANCNTYNADFDGDEMNMHFPQNEIARAEAMFIASNDEQYLVPTSGSPLRGLIQDHVVTGTHMTSRDTFFTREQYHQVLYGALRPDEDGTGGGRIVTIPPAIWSPKPLWTGKQVISTIMKNLTLDRPQLNLVSKSQVPGQYWGAQGAEEAGVLFMEGELLRGVLDKSQFGAKAYGLVHSCYELYGSNIAGKLLSILGRLFTKYVQMIGFTCRMDDLQLTAEGDKWRRDLIDGGGNFGRETAREYAGLGNTPDDAVADAELQRRMEEVLRSDEKMAGMDAAMKGKMNGLTSSVINKCLPGGLRKKFPSNNMQMMTVSGAKGSSVNVSQISCMLGQQELEGRRVPTMVSGKTLPSFRPFETTARAGGYIAGRFLTGIRPQEYYFHCMAGREGLIDTAVKTSRSGYLQRCLIKHLEGLTVHYDHTVRDSDGSVLQFRYGEDALDVVKQKHLYQFRFSADNFDALLEKYHPANAMAVLNTEDGEEHAKKALRKPAKYDPVLSEYTPSRYLYSTSEKFQKSYESYIETNPDNILSTKNLNPLKRSVNAPDITKKKFRALMALRYLHSLVEPGEAVGLLAAQSIGEPSTQMTLNTFHFAGFGAKNVTLGIPRLREIVMTASADIKTPTMTLPLLDDISEERSRLFCKEISRLTLAEVTDEIVVSEKLTAKEHGRRYKRYTIRLNLFHKDEYKEEHNIKPSQIENVLEKNFVKKLETAIQRDLRKVHRKGKGEEEKEGEEDVMDISKPAKRSRQKTSAAMDDSADVSATQDPDASDDDDNDASAAKRGAARTQHATYDAPDDDDAEVIAAADRQTAKEDDDVSDSDDSDDESSSDETPEVEGVKKTNGAKNLNDSQKAREARITETCSHVIGYRFDQIDGSWCEIDLQFPANTKKLLMVGIVEKVCRDVVVNEIPRIGRCFPVVNESENDTSRSLASEGCNLKGVWTYADVIDLNKIYSNDIAAILKTYGVEAARGAIMQEVSGVFGVYGIEVDKRHLSLIADYMTFEGGYKPFNRSGIESNVSPFLKMSFETTCHFLTQATIFGGKDSLASPSARLVLGKVVNGGTGSFDVYQPLF